MLGSNIVMEYSQSFSCKTCLSNIFYNIKLFIDFSNQPYEFSYYCDSMFNKVHV